MSGILQIPVQFYPFGFITLNGLIDVVITAVANNDVLVYDSGTSKWVNRAVGAIVPVVTLTNDGGGTNVGQTPVVGNAIHLNTLAGAGLVSLGLASNLITITGNHDTLNGLTDVTIAAPSNGQALTYNSGTSEWNNTTLAGTPQATTAVLGTVFGSTQSTANAATVLGYYTPALALGNNNVVIGTQTNTLTTGTANTLIGSDAGNNLTTGNDNIIIGRNADANAVNCIRNVAIGRNALVGGTAVGCVAVGDASNATGTSGSTTLGSFASCTASSGVAVGQSSQSTSTDAVAIGHSAAASNLQAVAIGASSSASGGFGIAIGNTAIASAGGAIALGYNSAAASSNGISIGQFTSVATDSIAIGSLSSAPNANSISLGASSVSDATNQVHWGTQDHQKMPSLATDNSNGLSFLCVDGSGVIKKLGTGTAINFATGTLDSSNSFTPTIANLTNLSSVSVTNGTYIRLGPIVLVEINFNALPTVFAATFAFTSTLPIATATGVGSGMTTGAGLIGSDFKGTGQFTTNTRIDFKGNMNSAGTLNISAFWMYTIS